MEQLENYMVMPRPEYRTWQEIEDYQEHLLEMQDEREDIEC